MISIYYLHSFFKGTKLIVIAVLLIFCTFNYSRAQYYGNEYGGLTGGIYAGMTFSQVNGDGFRGYDKFGYAAGGVLILPSKSVLPFPGTIAYSLGVQFTQKGARGRNIAPGIKEQIFDLNYAEVPVMLHYYRGHRKSNIGLGLSFGYLAWEETSIDVGAGLTRMPNEYRKFDLNFVLGANLHLYKGFFLSPKFQTSLINIKNKNVPTVGRSEQFNDLISIGVTYVLNRKDY